MRLGALAVMKSEIDVEMDEEFFPGNQAAYLELGRILHDRGVVAFVGAGVSVPDIPAWSNVLAHMIDDAQTSGLLSAADAREIKSRSESDPLETATVLEEALTRSQFRSMIGKTFSVELCTDRHLSLLDLPFSAFVTLNFDSGLSSAFVQKHGKMPDIIRPSDRYQLVQWRQGAKLASPLPPILQWHGVASAPAEMVFTGQDYDRFYGDADNISFIQELWRNQHVVAVGFGFSDPFLTRVLEQSLRNLESENRHFAFVGYRGDAPTTPLARRIFTRKYRLSPIFYRVLVDEITGKEDHSGLSPLLRGLRSDTPTQIKDAELASKPDTSVSTPTVDTARKDFEKDLLVAANGVQLYVEPRLYKPAEVVDAEGDLAYDPIDLSSIINSSRSFVISAPHEYGLTTLARRIYYEIDQSQVEVVFRDADQLPDYRAKLLKDAVFVKSGGLPSGVLILDSISFQVHERLIKEIRSLERFERIIILAKAQNSATQVEDAQLGADFDVILLSNLERADIRVLAEQMYHTGDEYLLSGVVDKVYSDLLALCIPLTPANVVMYLSVVLKEGDFVPLSRLQIIDRYVRDLLRRPSDPYRDMFNVDNKLDVVSLFVNKLYSDKQVLFSAIQWSAFCTDYMKKALIAFDEASMLKDLAASRVLGKMGNQYYFKYRLFYSFFLGRFVANRPAALKTFLMTNDHMQIDGLVEVISGLSADNTMLIEDLCDKLEQALNSFSDRYDFMGLDPHDDLEWSNSQIVEDKTWQDVTEHLASGPVEVAEIDKVKRSILAERRTEDQAVIIRDFSSMEKDISIHKDELSVAISNAVDVSGELKLRAVRLIFDAYMTMFRIGVVFSPVIASRKYFVWNGVGFANRLDYGDDEVDNLERQTAAVLSALPRAVLNRAVYEIGSRKLGEVYAKIADSGELAGFQKLLNFVLLLRSKPTNWERVADKIICSTDRKALYLRYMLSSSMRQFKEEVNTNHERGLLKRLVATIQAKRQLKRAAPNSTTIARVVEKLDEIDYFEQEGGVVKSA